MKLTDRQKRLLANIDQITSRKLTSGRRGFFLRDDNCTGTINSLIVRGAIEKTPDGRGLLLAIAGGKAR